MRPHVTGETTVAELAELWLRHLRAEDRLENTTINEYERVLNKLVLGELGPVCLRDLTTSRIDNLLHDLGAQSLNRQRKARVITGAMLNMAARHGALSVNPVRGNASIRRPKSERRSLSVDDLATVRAAVRGWMSKDRPGPKGTTDMADIVDLMLATGARIGEVLALRWSDVHLDNRQPAVRLSGTIKTETGKGTYRKPTPGVRTVGLTESAVDVLRRRRTETPRNSIDAVFPTRNGTWQQVNNVERRWRQIRQEADLDWVTPQAFRNVDNGAL